MGQVAQLIKMQAEQIEHKTVYEYIADKYNIRSDADGQEKAGSISKRTDGDTGA